MPRTKRIQNQKTQNQVSNKDNEKEKYVKALDCLEARYMEQLDEELASQLRSIHLFYLNQTAQLSCSHLNATVEEFVNGKFQNTASASILSTYSTLFNANSTSNPNLTKTLKSSNSTTSKKPVHSSRIRSIRSNSCSQEDEGYRTCGSYENNAGAHRGRRSRSAATNKENTMMMPKKTRNSKFHTPINHQSIANGGFITPKCQPNTPHLFLRRPKQGEEVWSNQGSPLLVGSVTSERKAAINIPLKDGNCISLLPARCATLKDMPDFNASTIEELAILRDNLIKLCKTSKN